MMIHSNPNKRYLDRFRALNIVNVITLKATTEARTDGSKKDPGTSKARSTLRPTG